MNYCTSKTVDGDQGQVEEKVRAALKEQGFGILTEIDVQATLREKINEEIGPYKILGACNPRMAKGALDLEPRIGVMLPCNVILRGAGEGKTEVSAVDPVASMAAVENDALKKHAEEVKVKLNLVMDSL